MGSCSRASKGTIRRALLIACHCPADSIVVIFALEIDQFRVPTGLAVEMNLGIKKALSRRALVKPNLFFYFWKFGVNARRTKAAKGYTQAYSDVPAIAEEINREGIITGNVSEFLSPEGLEHFSDAKAEILKLSRSKEIQQMVAAQNVSDEFRSNSGKNFLVTLIKPSTEHLADGPILKLALDPKLLEVISSYLGLWPRLYQIHSWLNYPTEEPPQASQMWHRDPEDIKLIKVFIYLVDVDKDTGPFTFIPRTHSFGEFAGQVPQHKDRKRVEDNEMNPTLSPDLHRVCTGPEDTMILADTVGYHRGGKPRSNNRLLLTFTYTSAWQGRPGPVISGTPSWPMNDMQRMAL
jgi:hypothetical protein